jgi:amidophosphoribosyltransferase
VLATELQSVISGIELEPEQIFTAVTKTHQRLEGSYAVVSLIAGYGVLAFRDPYGIRPLIIGRKSPERTGGHPEWMIASESVTLETAGFTVVRDVEPGEAIFITGQGELFARQCAARAQLVPCAFEYIYLARPDSIMNGISVYEARLRLGDRLADTISKQLLAGDIDVVMPVPDTARPVALQVARRLGIDYREGFHKNFYVGRTFIMPGQAQRRQSVRQKLNPMPTEFAGRNVLIVEDSIVRGTTSMQIIELARAAGANSVTFASAAPPLRHPNVYGINLPTPEEFIAHNRNLDQITERLGADRLIYQEIDDLEAAIIEGSQIKGLELSCFTGDYITGMVSDDYLAWVRETQLS